MENQYIKELLEKMEHVEIWKDTSEKCKNYDEGIK